MNFKSLPKVLCRTAKTIAAHRLALGAFLIPALIRTVPEILAGPYPVGWDIITYYIPNSLDLASGSMNIWSVITSPPLMYAFVVPLYVLTRANLVLIFKIMGPVLYGLLGWSTFRFTRSRLHWTDKKAFYAVLFVSAYFVTLRIGWDAYQAELGLVLFLLAESIVARSSLRSTGARISLISLAAISNQLVAALVVGTQLVNLMRRSIWTKSAFAALELLPIALFGLIGFATLQTSLASELSVAGSGFGLLSFADSTMFLVYAYAFLIPLLLLGLKMPERSVFGSWIAVCAVGLLLALLPGPVFQAIGYRWALLLAIPTLLVAYEGFTKLSSLVGIRSHSWSFALRVSVLATLSVTATLFVVLPAQSAFPFFTMYPQYSPSSMVQSSLPSSDYSNVVNAMVWLDGNTDSDSAVITQQAFYGWAREYLSSGTTILNSYLSSPTSIVAQAGSYDHVFTVWWVKGAGWFPGSFPEGAVPVAYFGDLAVYQYR